MADPVRIQEGNDEFRWVLTERWADGPMLGIAGMNPSKASAEKTDPSWTRWRTFSQRWGYGAQCVMNPVPKRSSTPEHAVAWLQEIAAGRIDNSAIVANLEHARRMGPICAAWLICWGDKGAQMNDAYRVHRDFLAAIRGATDDGPLLAFGLTANGNPKHVLARGTSRLPDDAPVFQYFPLQRRIAAQPFEHPTAPNP